MEAAAAGPRVAWLLAMNDDGIPVLTRTHGVPAPPLTAKGLVFALAEAGQEKHRPLRCIATDDGTLCFRKYPAGLLLALLWSRRGVYERLGASDAEGGDEVSEGEAVASAVLDAAYDAATLLLGKRELRAAQNTMGTRRLQKALHLANGLLDFCITELPSRGIDPAAPDVLALPEEPTLSLTRFVEAIAEAAELDDMPVGLLMGGACVAGTRSWWALDGHDIGSLLTLHQAMPAATARDMIVYLPRSSLEPDETPGMVATRLLTVMLSGGVHPPPVPAQRLEVVMLVRGGRPSLDDAIETVSRLASKGEAEATLRGICGRLETPCPSVYGIDSHLLGFISSIDSDFCVAGASERRIVSVVGRRVPARQRGGGASGGAGGAAGAATGAGAAEWYAAALHHKRKLHAFYQACSASNSLDDYVVGRAFSMCFIRRPSRRLAVLFTSDVPTRALVGLTERALTALNDNVVPLLRV